MRSLRALLPLSLVAFLPGCMFVVESDGKVRGANWWQDESSGNCVVGSGVLASESREVAEFRAVRGSGSVDLVVRVGAGRAVLVRGDDNLIERIETVVEDGELRVRVRSGGYRTRQPLVVEISTPSLDELSLSGSGDAVISGLAGGAFSIHVSGSGDVRASGSLDELVVSLSGSGDVELTDLAARRASVALSGSGDARIHATEELTAAISGSGDVSYRGSPKVRKVVSGSGDVRARP